MIDLTDRQLDDYAGVLPCVALDVDQAVAAVQPICDAVRDEGRQALARFSEQFDHVVPEHFRVPAQALSDALASLMVEVAGDRTVHRSTPRSLWRSSGRAALAQRRVGAGG